VAEILTYPDNRLLQISGLIRDFKDKEQVEEIVNELKKTIDENDIIGLSAVQIGTPKRIIVFKKNNNFIVMINPSIYGKEGKYFSSKETDESLPEIYVTVNRYPTIKIIYQDLDGNDKFYVAKDQEAIFLQRKIDMVFGGYLFDKIPKKEQKDFFRNYGSYGDTCPSYFVKDTILKIFRYFLTLNFILLVLSMFMNFARFVLKHNTTVFAIELVWIVFYAFYARYETSKYKNCTSCQNANILGTSMIYTTISIVLYGVSWTINWYLSSMYG